MRKKPAACSKVLSPKRGTFNNSLRLENAPLASRKAIILDASVAFKPDTWVNKGAEAVLRSTPTEFTQSSTTASKERASWFWLTSCWYWPTPMDLGSDRKSTRLNSSHVR